MIGYWEDLKKGRCRNYQRNGFDTGDLVQTDTAGRLYIVGRKDDMIQVAGERIAPKAIEDVILKLPGICEVAAFGIEDVILGQKIAAFYYAKGKNRDEEIRQHCRRHLPAYMVPHMLAACNRALPKNAAGKISRQDLRKQVQRDTLAADSL
jgi:long-chain acyl-CoA synthetase